MPRFESSGKMCAEAATSGSGGDQRTIQPGRLMIVLIDQLIANDLIESTVEHYGTIRSLHRTEKNPKNVFVQFEDPECVTDQVIASLKKLDLFKDVSRAKKADRFIDSDFQDYNQQQQQQQQMQPKRPQKKRNDGQNNFNGQHNNSLLGRPPPQPNIPMGCWYCSNLPSFECRCGAFYCNSNCQRDHWPSHRDFCMPPLVPISFSQRQIFDSASNGFNNSYLMSPDRQLMPQQPQHFKTNFSGGQQQHHQPNFGHQQQNRQQQQNQNRGPQGQKKNPQGQNNQHDNKNGGLQGNSWRQQQQQSPPEQQQQQQQPNESSRVSLVGSKLGRLKLAKASSSTAKNAGKLRILEHGPFPPEGARVKITASLNSGVLYIYHNNSRHSAQSDYQELSNRVLTATNNSQPLTESPRVDDIIFAPYDNQLYRAKVLRAADAADILEVQFVDFGNLDRVSWRKSCVIADEELKWARVLTHPVRLENVDEFAPEMKAKLESYELVEEFELVKIVDVRDSDIKQVVLRRPKENVTLSMQLVELKQTEAREKKRREEQQERERLEKVRREREEERVRLEKEKQAKRESDKIADPDNYRPVLFDDALTIKQLPEDSKQTLLIIDASDVLETSIISVIATRDAPLYEGVVADCETRGQADPNIYRPTEETEVCLVRYENDWSRGLYDISEGTFMLLDIGTIKSVPAENVRRFPPGLGLVVFNNEVVVENPAVLEKMMKGGQPESIHGQTIEAWVSKEDDLVNIRVIPAPASSQTN